MFLLATFYTLRDLVLRDLRKISNHHTLCCNRTKTSILVRCMHYLLTDIGGRIRPRIVCALTSRRDIVFHKLFLELLLLLSLTCEIFFTFLIALHAFKLLLLLVKIDWRTFSWYLIRHHTLILACIKIIII